MLAYSFIGLTAELFAEARRTGVPVQSAGPKPREVWVSFTDGWRVAPRGAMPLLLGVTSCAEGGRVVAGAGGELGGLTAVEHDDAELVVGRANTQGGGRCR